MRSTVSLLIVGLFCLGTAGPAGPAADHFTVSVDLQSSIRPLKFSAVAGDRLLSEGAGDDLFLIGQLRNGSPQASIYKLDNRSTDFLIVPPKVTSIFDEQVEISLRDVDFGDVAIADLDGNGESDIIYAGRTLFDISPEGNTYGEFTGIYYNFTAASEEPTLQLDEDSGIPALSHARLALADFDGDGDQDVVIAGNQNANTAGPYVLGVYLNGHTFEGRFGVSQLWEDGIRPTTIATGDYDGDGDQDFLIGGSLADGLPTVRLFSNDGDGTFSRQHGALPDLYFAAADFGDVDGDGDDELLLSGGVLGPTLMRGVTTLYEYEAEALQPRTDIDLPGLFYGQLEFGDMEGDGDLDFFLHGLSDPAEPLGQRLLIFRNDSGSLSLRSDVRSTVFGGAAWVDYDGNGTKEIFVTGEHSNEHRVMIYEFL